MSSSRHHHRELSGGAQRDQLPSTMAADVSARCRRGSQTCDVAAQRRRNTSTGFGTSRSSIAQLLLRHRQARTSSDHYLQGKRFSRSMTVRFNRSARIGLGFRHVRATVSALRSAYPSRQSRRQPRPPSSRPRAPSLRSSTTSPAWRELCRQRGCADRAPGSW